MKEEETMSSRSDRRRIEDLEEAVAYLATDKKTRSKIPPPPFLVLYGYNDSPSRSRS
jgi:hypothetical protein